MAFPKVFIHVSVLLVIFARFTWADAALLSEEAIAPQAQEGGVSESNSAKLVLYQLKSKISSLETIIEEHTGELKRRDGGIHQLEKIVGEKSNSLATLQSTFQSLQEKRSLKVKERIGAIDMRVTELEKQIVKLEKEIEAQNNRKDELEAQANVAEKKIKGLNLKLENLQRINDEQKSRIRRAQHALQVAEEEMLKAKLGASPITKQLKEVHQAWFPPCLSAHLVHCQSFILTNWNELGRPALNLTIQKALKQISEVEKWVQPHLEIIRTKWLPTIKEQCQVVTDHFRPVVQSLASKATHYHHVAQNTIHRCILKMQVIMGLYFKEMKMLMKPYADQVSEIAQPYLEKAHVLLKPCSRMVVHYHRKITKNIQVYHLRVQATLHETLNSYELTKPLATGGLVPIMASMLMALPVIAVLRIFLQKESTKSCRSTKRGHTNRSHTRRRAKRVHPDK